MISNLDRFFAELETEDSQPHKAPVEPNPDRYAALMQAALATINRAGCPEGMVVWLDRAHPRLYLELTSRITDEIDRLWNEFAPLDQFQAALDRLVGLHRECCRLYREEQADIGVVWEEPAGKNRG
jgi:hypothetical protein